MSPDILKTLLDLGFSAVFIFMLNKLYEDSKAERAVLLSKIDALLESYDRLKDRVIMIEAHLGIDDPPTLSKRPQESDPVIGQTKPGQ